MEQPEYHLCKFDLDHRRAYFIWRSADTDEVILDPSGRLATFSSQKAAKGYAARRGFKLAKDSLPHYDLDAISRFCADPKAGSVDCNVMIDAWNLFGDLHPRKKAFRGSFQRINREADAIYEKLFFGLNLPSVTPKGKSYSPKWSRNELAKMAVVLRAGLEEFRTLLT